MPFAENNNAASNDKEACRIESNSYYFSADFAPKDHGKIFIEWTNKQVVTDSADHGKSHRPLHVSDTFIIQTEEEFHMALARFNEIIDAESTTNEAAELNALEKAIDTYWEILYPKN